jgi:hypothetical protein
MTTLYLGIPPASGIDWGAFPSFAIQRFLQTWLSSCCVAPTHVRVNFTNRRPNATLLDGIVYLVGQRSDSIIARVKAPESSNLTAGQTSIKDGGMLSEVYVNPLSVYGTAATIYHELLHNKLGIGFNVHGTEGGNFTTATAPYSEGGPSAADQKLMCHALSSPMRQYEGGFDASI